MKYIFLSHSSYNPGIVFFFFNQNIIFLIIFPQSICCEYSLEPSLQVNIDFRGKMIKNTRATSEDSDQPAHPRSLIRVFADRMRLLQSPGYLKIYKQEPLPYWGM